MLLRYNGVQVHGDCRGVGGLLQVTARSGFENGPEPKRGEACVLLGSSLALSELLPLDTGHHRPDQTGQRKTEPPEEVNPSRI